MIFNAFVLWIEINEYTQLIDEAEKSFLIQKRNEWRIECTLPTSENTHSIFPKCNCSTHMGESLKRKKWKNATRDAMERKSEASTKTRRVNAKRWWCCQQQLQRNTDSMCRRIIGGTISHKFPYNNETHSIGRMGAQCGAGAHQTHFLCTHQHKPNVERSHTHIHERTLDERMRRRRKSRQINKEKKFCDVEKLQKYSDKKSGVWCYGHIAFGAARRE